MVGAAKESVVVSVDVALEGRATFSVATVMDIVKIAPTVVVVVQLAKYSLR